MPKRPLSLRPSYQTSLRLLLLPYAVGIIFLVLIPAVLSFGLAFFQYDDEEAYERLRQNPGSGSHIALKIEQDGYDGVRARLKDARIAFTEMDHGYCHSLYCSSPDGLTVEFTVDPPDAAEIAAARRADCHAELKRWMAGDRQSNNGIRPGRAE